MSLLSWLNPLNAIIKVAGDVVNKKADVSLEKYKVDGNVNVSAMNADVKIIEARAALAAAMKNDTVTKWCRGLLLVPTCLWFALIIWDSCFRELLPDWATWRVLALPKNIEYIPYAAVAYLLVTAWKK